MKAVFASQNEVQHDTDFYIKTLAPVNELRRRPIRGVDAILVIVLFLEIAGLARLILAN
jgi:hypothetical protein